LAKVFVALRKAADLKETTEPVYAGEGEENPSGRRGIERLRFFDFDMKRRLFKSQMRNRIAASNLHPKTESDD